MAQHPGYGITISMQLRSRTLDIPANLVSLEINGNITSDHIGILEQELSEIAKGKPVKLILDMSGVKSIDSTGVGALISGRNVIAANGGKVAIIGAGKQVLTVLKISGLETYFLIAPTEYKAIKLLEEED